VGVVAAARPVASASRPTGHRRGSRRSGGSGGRIEFTDQLLKFISTNLVHLVAEVALQQADPFWQARSA
jgi:hypothetical protein